MNAQINDEEKNEYIDKSLEIIIKKFIGRRKCNSCNKINIFYLKNN